MGFPPLTCLNGCFPSSVLVLFSQASYTLTVQSTAHRPVRRHCITQELVEVQNLGAGVVSPHTHSIRIYILTRFSGDLHSLSSLSSPGSHTFLARPVELHLLQSVVVLQSSSSVLFKAVDFIWVWQLRSGPHPLQRAVYRRYPWALGVSQRWVWGPRKPTWLAAAAASTSLSLLARSSLGHRAQG